MWARRSQSIAFTCVAIVGLVYLTTFLISSHPIKVIYPESLSTPERLRWSGYAYVQYVTNPTYLCNSVMILEALDRHATMADKIMMYPETWDVNGPENTSVLMRKARDEY
jgi:hypothetical protein